MPLSKAWKLNFKRLKGVQSKEKLTYKGTLLNDVVSKEVVGVRTFALVLNIRPSNISYVVQKKQHVELTSSSQWTLITRTQRYEFLDAATVSCVLDWWSKETWVSPNKFDALEKLITLKVYEEHVMHLLMETQVNMIISYNLWGDFPSFYSWFYKVIMLESTNATGEGKMQV
jgi:hypothetical protein